MQEQHLSDFDFELPPELIAQYPLENRTASRLLHITKDVIEDCTFTDIEGFLHEGDLLVANNTKVIKARLLGHKATGGNVEALIERVTGERTAISMVRASKSPKPGAVLYFEADGIEEPVMVTGRQGQFFELEFERPVLDVLEAFGRVPLPPYITHAAQKSDESRYQTVYAKHDGSAAAPTAGLHFTQELLQEIQDMGVTIAHVTLHVGLGTFRPVQEDEISDHKMHSEWYSISEETAQRIRETKAAGHRVIAVGTTSCRTLEAAAAKYGEIKACSGNTSIFLYPGVKFNCIDGLITNFHLPESTLIMLVSALYGYEKTMAAYKVAVEEKYRFFSFGDAMFIRGGNDPEDKK